MATVGRFSARQEGQTNKKIYAAYVGFVYYFCIVGFFQRHHIGKKTKTNELAFHVFLKIVFITHTPCGMRIPKIQGKKMR